MQNKQIYRHRKQTHDFQRIWWGVVVEREIRSLGLIYLPYCI